RRPRHKQSAWKTREACGQLRKPGHEVGGDFGIFRAGMGPDAVAGGPAVFRSGSEKYFMDGFPPARFVDPAYYTPFVWVSFLASAIPLLALVLLSVRMISDVKISKYLGYSLLIIWLTSIGFLIYYGSAISMDHAINGSVVEEVDLVPQPVYHL